MTLVENRRSEWRSQLMIHGFSYEMGRSCTSSNLLVTKADISLHPNGVLSLLSKLSPDFFLLLQSIYIELRPNGPQRGPDRGSFCVPLHGVLPPTSCLKSASNCALAWQAVPTPAAVGACSQAQTEKVRNVICIFITEEAPVPVYFLCYILLIPCSFVHKLFVHANVLQEWLAYGDRTLPITSARHDLLSWHSGLMYMYYVSWFAKWALLILSNRGSRWH